MNKVLSFFTFFIAEMNTIDMKIPTAFTQSMEQPLPEKVFLRDRHNHQWIVKVAKVGNYWYFVDGWDKFVSDNLLASGDLMVFQYPCEDLFNVKLYAASSTEKNVAAPSAFRGVEKHAQVSENEEETADDDDNEDDEEKTESENYDHIITSPDRDRNEDDQDDADEEGVDGQENECNQVVPRNVNTDGAVVAGDNSAQGRLQYLYPRCYGMDIFEAGVAQQPTNPYFVTKIMPKRKSDLFIPQDVIKDYSLDLGHEVILVDPNGREFRAKCRKWKDGRSILSGGWIRLCRVNLVKIEDKCICEFMTREGDQRQFLHITFVRSNI